MFNSKKMGVVLELLGLVAMLLSMAAFLLGAWFGTQHEAALLAGTGLPANTDNAHLLGAMAGGIYSLIIVLPLMWLSNVFRRKAAKCHDAK